MIYLETGDLYYNTRMYFRNNVLDTLPNDDRAWYWGYRKWLAEQGCELIRSQTHGDYAVDVLGVWPGVDRFGFQSEADAALFALRWS